MRIFDVISKKKRGGELSREEIFFVVEGFTRGEIPDYQMSALLMAICFVGMMPAETAALTQAMVASGESVTSANAVDKHSTGGVGDKTTLAVVPIVAACGVKIAKMSGRGLGHTGGTIDKLEAIPGFRTALSGDEFREIVETHGACIAGQSANLAPADKKIYALRDVTATVDSIPLIAASIMSKKIAAGADAILLDVKTGSGAFMKNLKDARELARTMVEIGEACGRKTAALITDMSAPLGYAVGNALEVIEVAQILTEKAPALSENLRTLCEELSAQMLHLAGKGNIETCRALARDSIESGAALKKFADIVEAQGGDRSYIEDTENFAKIKAAYSREIFAGKSGYISEIFTEGIGIAAMILGAGREKPADRIDPSAGIVLNFTLGDFVEKGQLLARLDTSAKRLADEAEEKFLESLTFSDSAPDVPPLIY